MCKVLEQQRHRKGRAVRSVDAGHDDGHDGHRTGGTMYDIWKKQAINELEMYEANIQAQANIADQIRELEAALTSIRSPGADAECIRVGGNGKDDWYLNNITARELLRENLTATRKSVKRVERSLDVMNEEEKMILRRFFITQEKKAADRLAGDLRVDVKTVYFKRDAALRKFTVAMYGKH